jgi:glyoxalase family protein
MNQLITGIHHVTGMAGEPQKNIDFYTGILGLRLVKKTVNFDATDVYHFYYGNELGAPGTILTFFPFAGIPRGRQGKGQLTVTSFSIPVKSLDYWMGRLKKFNVSYTSPRERFGNEAFVYFEDHDGLGLELVANDSDKRQPFSYGNIPQEHAIRGFYGVTLAEEGYERTAGMLTHLLGHTLLKEEGNRFRYAAQAEPGNFVDVICSPESMRGLSGSGTIHHVAFATESDQTQLKVREQLMSARVNVTPVLDRSYFHSIYFREPGGVLFEVATIPPGFATDETPAQLGQSLKLPPWVESQRKQIEKELPEVSIHPEKFKD